jgi:hypothetical protein
MSSHGINPSFLISSMYVSYRSSATGTVRS